MLSRTCAPSLQPAAEAWQRRDYGKAIEILICASQHQPDNAKILLHLGEAYGRRFEYDQAEHWLDKAVAVSSNQVEVLAEAGQCCQRFGQADMANRYFMRAAEHSRASPSVLVALAEFEEGHSRWEAALAWLERALQIESDHPGALLARARLHRLSGQLERGESLLRALVSKPLHKASIMAWYELGTNLDRQGNYDQAVEAFLQAKALLRPSAIQFEVLLSQLHADIRNVEQAASAATFKRWFRVNRALRPSRRLALLCGHARSGTTLLEQIFDAHPDIIATDETSILLAEAYGTLCRRFPENTAMLEILDSASIEELQRARVDYFRFTEAIIGEPVGQRLVIDKNPMLDVHIPLVARIFPEAKFLVAIRDPRDVCLSCFMLPLPPGRLATLYLSMEGIAAQYGLVMGFSRAIRGRLPNPQLEIRYEDVVQDLEGTSRRALTFLDVPWNEAVLRFADHAKTKLLRCAVDEAVARPIFTNSVGRWRHYQKYLEPHLPRLAPFVDAFGYS